MSSAYVIVRNSEVTANAATYDSAVAMAKQQAEDYAPDQAYIYQQVAKASAAVTVTVTAPLVQVKR